MCRLAGAVGDDLDPARIQAALDAQHHGGPDDQGRWLDPEHPVTLCHNRLSIIDTTRAGRQPMTSPNGSVALVFNGEIYNYKELRDELPPRAYQSATDSEVLLASYQEWGFGCLDRFNGMFAFALWDRRRKLLFCARDRLGIKPFHYAVHRGAFYFASEIKGLAALGVPTAPNMKAWADYLVHGCSDHCTDTFFQGVHSLAPGTSLVVRLGSHDNPSPRRYWDLPRLAQEAGLVREPGQTEVPDQAEEPGQTEGPRPHSEPAVQETLRELLDDSVRLRLRADVPVGVNLSGGLDSASLLASVAKRANEGARVHTFTATFGDPAYDETAFAGEAPGHVHWERNEARLDVAQVMELAKVATWHQEAPFGGVATLAYHKLHQLALERGVTVLLEGQGVDELFAGYRYYLPHHLLDLLEAGRRDRVRTDQMRSLQRGGAQAVSQDGTAHLRPQCASPAMRELAGPPPEFERPFPDRLRNVLYRDLAHTKLPRVLRMNDRLSMASARELREPFLDHRIVEFAFRLPGRWKIRDGSSKYALRRAMDGRLPETVRWAPKRAVVTPQREWLAGPLSTAVEEIVASPEFVRRGLFDAKEVAAELRSFREQGSPNSFHVWQWVATEMWFRRFAP